MSIDVCGYTLNRTCAACPEQYDVFKGVELVGYLRLRHGRFCASYPDVNGRVVYSSDTIGDGMFEDKERTVHLFNAVDAIHKEHTDTNRGGTL